MNHSEMTNYIDKVLIPKLKETRDQAQEEYAEPDNVFANFENVARFVGDTRDKAIMTYMIKHIQGLGSYTCKGVVAQREGVEGRIVDAIIYLMLLSASIYDNKNKKKEYYKDEHKEND